MKNKPVIAQLTDFGLSDAYVGTMKGVMLSICPDAQIVDITHAIQPQNVRQAAYVLLTAFRYFPSNTVYNIVVDPGVGTAREPIAVETDRGTFVAPNNGVLSYILPGITVKRAVELANPEYRLTGISTTFHGRDIFSPAAAHLAAGVPIEKLGPELSNLIELPQPRLKVSANVIEGEILHIDHFGNVITSIGLLSWNSETSLDLAPQFGETSRPSHNLTVNAQTSQVTIGDQTLRSIRPTYGMVPPGTLTSLVGSSGQLEVGVNQGSAAQRLEVSLGDPVALHLSS